MFVVIVHKPMLNVIALSTGCLFVRDSRTFSMPSRTRVSSVISFGWSVCNIKIIFGTFAAYIEVYIKRCFILPLDVWSLLVPYVSCRVKSNRHWWNTDHAVDTLYEIKLKCPMFLHFCVWFNKFLHSWHCMFNDFTFLCII